jgi:hypothetical protein
MRLIAQPNKAYLSGNPGALHLVGEAYTIYDSIIRERKNHQAKPDHPLRSLAHGDERAAREEVLENVHGKGTQSHKEARAFTCMCHSIRGRSSD